MSSQRDIEEVYHIQVTPQRYTVNQEDNSLTYRCLQKISCNTISLSTFSCINAFQNINEFYNQIGFKIGTVQHYVRIPESSWSFWSIFDMITILNTQINLQIPGQNFVVSLTGNNNKFVQITNTNAFNMIFTTSRNQNQINRYLGFGNAQNPQYSVQATTQVALFPFNIQVTSQINLVVKNMSFNTEIIGCIAQIPLSAPITEIIIYQNTLYEANRQILVKHGIVAINELIIQLQDDEGNAMNIQNNRVSLTFLCEKFARADGKY